MDHSLVFSFILLFLLTLSVHSLRVPLLGEENPDRIEDQYIVIYHENTTNSLLEEHWHTMGVKSHLLFTYNFGSFKGFASKMTASVLAHLLEDPLVKEVHCDGLAWIVENSCDATQTKVPSWGLARVSHKGGVSTGLNEDYYYNSQFSGAGVTAYILDTGIYIEHNDFGGRASHGPNYADQVQTDENGHGTHGAGIVGGTTYGIAKNVKLVSVKVIGKSGSGTFSAVLAGIQWITEQHISTGGPSVVCVSLGASTDGGTTKAITSSVEAGVVYTVASGNSNADACLFYPSSCPVAITVASTQLSAGVDKIDIRAPSSNYGKCVDLFAPGTTITSCGISSPTSYVVHSGSSKACPHVTGSAAVILSQNPKATPAQVVQILRDNAQNGLIGNVGTDSPNLLLYNKCDEALL